MNIILLILKQKIMFIVDNYQIIILLSKMFPQLFVDVKINNLVAIKSDYYIIEIPKIRIIKLDKSNLKRVIKYVETKNIKPIIIQIKTKDDLVNLFIKYFNSLATNKINI